jgi:acyl-coenzyme A synthetase/AMP-(fatty) acid ligase
MLFSGDVMRFLLRYKESERLCSLLAKDSEILKSLDYLTSQSEMRVQDGSLRIRSSRTASGYASHYIKTLADEEGYVDTGDMVELRNGRYYFVGRREGIINVGGNNVYPEEVEAVVNLHPGVHMSRVMRRPSPITGAIVVADIVIKPCYSANGLSLNTIKNEILSICRLPAHKVPVSLREVPSLDIAASGKLVGLRA